VLLDAIATQIDKRIFDALVDLDSLADSLTPAMIANPGQAQHLLDALKKHQVFFDNSLFLFSRSGKLIAASPQELNFIGKDYSSCNYFKETVETGKICISPPSDSIQKKSHLLIMFTTPVYDTGGKIIAVLGGGVNLKQHHYLRSLAALKLGLNGFLSLYDTNRTVLMHPIKYRFLQQDRPGANTMLDKALQGYEGTSETVTQSGIAVLRSVKTLKSTGWVLAISYPLKDACAPLFTARKYYSFGIILAALLSILIVWPLMKYLTSPLLAFIRHLEQLPAMEGALLVPIRSNDEIGVMGQTFNRMIIELKRLEQEKVTLEAQNQQLQKAESLSRMAGAIAHNFNNQLQTVMGNLELAMDSLSRGTGPIEELTEAMKAASRAAEVSRLMLTYLGQSSARHEPLELSEACRRSLPMLRAAMPKDMKLVADFPTSGPTIKANAHQIQQVLSNLATNGWEAMGDGRDAIRLAVTTVSPAEIPATHRFPLNWQPQDTLYACLEVKDAGCGIAARDIDKLFDPFFTSKFTGRGLGLSVVLGIVRAHHGAITVESNTARGSIFRVFFPVTAEAVTRQPQKEAPAPRIEWGGTVLLVEDEQNVRGMAQVLLTKLGFAVLAAKDGIEAVELFKQKKETIRFVLSDLTMPHMDGWETLAALRKLAPGIPVVLASGYDQAQVMVGDHTEWPQAFLGKPYQLAELREAIRRALETGLDKGAGGQESRADG
jgi:signal transduction histidine kinase/ActR/RegA family two-component response regulator